MGARELASFAALLADETRAGFCLALLDGRAWTAGELARAGGVAASTASEHLGKLVAGGLLSEARQGRHRYVRIADEGVAHLVEELAAYAGGGDTAPRGLRAVNAEAALARGRTCYDHLAGRLGIAITEAMVGRGLLEVGAGVALSGQGVEWFGELGIPLEVRGRRPLVRVCLDWTERKPHLAGVAGAALCRHAMEVGWCERVGRGRAVRVTGGGERVLGAVLGISAESLR
ncbi:ArsR/SmtB family transcription factor [Streptomyces sp. NBC_01465]|uniref:ArsR/SmtB family transcription factor n=1 Tax=Streptomyces sp. NBC_01465 TaxID=2903878 RepID=UPI002E355DBB|nr:winged helix-turn-helix domain-containing protein [Streptomyces sp. NBC_01465]